MSGLRQTVAAAIQADADCGGLGVLTKEEQDAIEWAITLPVDWCEHEKKRHRQILALLIHDLGHGRMHIHGSAKPRVDQYYLHCADVAIDAYDKWLDERKKEKP